MIELHNRNPFLMDIACLIINRKRERQVYFKINLIGCNGFDTDGVGLINTAEKAKTLKIGAFT